MSKIKDIFKDFKKREKLLNAISVLNLIVLFLSRWVIKPYDRLIIINIAIFILIEYILSPLNKNYKKSPLKEKNILIKSTFKVIIMIIFCVSFYRIFFGRNYDLKYTYYFAFITLFIMLIEAFFKIIYKVFKNRNSKKYGRLNLLYYMVLSLIILSLISNFAVRTFAVEQREIELDDIKLPKEISISEVTDNFQDNTSKWLSDYKSYDIDSPQDIAKIMEDIKSRKIKNIKGIKLFNYIKMQEDTSKQYIIWFNYDDKSIANSSLDEGYISHIRLNSNGLAVIEELNFSKGMIFDEKANYYKFPIELSKDTIDLIYSYIK